MDRLPHRDPTLILLVALGGMIGTSLRLGLGLLFPPVRGLPLTTMAINLVGAFALSLLLRSLSIRAADSPRPRAIRFFVGTGLLGGFTTYSALANDSAALIGSWPLGAVLYALATVTLGALATLAGIATANTLGMKESR